MRWDLAQSPGACLIENGEGEVLNVNTARFWKAFILMDILQEGDTTHNIFKLVTAFQFWWKVSL